MTVSNTNISSASKSNKCFVFDEYTSECKHVLFLRFVETERRFFSFNISSRSHIYWLAIQISWIYFALWFLIKSYFFIHGFCTKKCSFVFIFLLGLWNVFLTLICITHYQYLKHNVDSNFRFPNAIVLISFYVTIKLAKSILVEFHFRS